MIDIYLAHFMQDGVLQENRTLIQTIPAKSEGELYLVSPKVDVKVGSAESMSFAVEPKTKYYDAFVQMRTHVEVEYDGDLIFDGRVLTIEQGFYGERQIQCEGSMAYFNDSYFPGIVESERQEITLGKYINDILENHNSQLNDPLRAIYPGEVPGHYTNETAPEQMIDNVTRAFGENGWRQTRSTLDDLADHYGGMFRVRRIDGSLYLDWYKHYFRSTVNQQIVEVGKNLIDLSFVTEVNNIFTVIVPIGKGQTENSRLMIDGTYFPVSRVTEFYTDEELNSGYHLAEDYRSAEERYGVIIKPQEFNDATNEEELLQECAKWVKENYQGGVDEFSVSAVDMHQIGKNGNDIQKILAGDRVGIRRPIGNGHTEDRTLTCKSATYELYDPENNAYTYGIPASSLKSYSVNQSKTNKDAESQETPNYGGGTPDTRTEYQKWWDKTKKWLNSHKVWNKSNGGTKDRWREGGPRSPSEMNYFVHLINEKNSDGKYLAEVWCPAIYTTYNVNTPDGKQVTVYVWDRDSNNKPRGTWAKVTRDDLKDRKYNWNSHNLLSYVYEEYFGLNLGANMPAMTIEEEGFLASATSFIEENVPGIGNILNPNGKISIKELLDGSGLDLNLGSVGDIVKTVINGDLVNSISGSGLFSIGKDLVGKFTEIKEQAGQFITEHFNINLGGIFDPDNPASSLFGVNQENDDGSHKKTVFSWDPEGNFNNNGNITASKDIWADNNLQSGNKVIAEKEIEAGTDVVAKQDMRSNRDIIAKHDLSAENDVLADRKVHAKEGVESDKGITAGTDITAGGSIYATGNMQAAGLKSTGGIEASGNITTNSDIFFKSGEEWHNGNELLNYIDNLSQDYTDLNSDYNDFKSDLAGKDAQDHYVLNGSKVVSAAESYSQGNLVVVKTSGTKSYLDSPSGSSAQIAAVNHITDVTKEFDVSEDSSHKIGLVVTAANGIKVKRSNVSYDVLDNGNFGGQNIIDKVNGYTGNTRIIGKNVSITNTSSGNALDSKITSIDTSITNTNTNVSNAVTRISNIETNYITATNFNSKVGSIDQANFNSILIASHLLFGVAGDMSIAANKLTLSNTVGSAVTTRTPKDFIRKVQIVSAGSNSYKLQYQLAFDADTTWTDAGTFSKAVSLSGSWSGGRYLVSATSGTISGAAPETTLFDLGLGSPTKGTGNIVQATFDIGYAAVVSGQQVRGGSTGKTGTLSLDVSGLLQTKNVTSNGTITPDDGYLGLSSVVVNVPSSSHNILLTSNASWYVSGSASEANAKSAAATAMGTSTSNLTHIDNGKFKNSSWIWFYVKCGSATKYYYTKVTS